MADKTHWAGAGFSFDADAEDVDFLNDTVDQLAQARRRPCYDRHDLEWRAQNVKNLIADIEYCANKAKETVA